MLLVTTVTRLAMTFDPLQCVFGLFIVHQNDDDNNKCPK